MAIALYSASNGTGAGLSWHCSYTAPGGSLLVFFAAWGGNSTPPTPTIGVLPFTFVIKSLTGSPGGTLGAWIIQSPPSGTNTIDLTFVNDPGGFGGMCTAVFTGASNCEASDKNATVLFNQADVSVTTMTDNDAVVSACTVGGSSAGFTNPTGYTTSTPEFSTAGGITMTAAYKKPITPPGTENLHWTWSSFATQGFTLALALTPGTLPGADNGLFMVSD